MLPVLLSDALSVDDAGYVNGLGQSLLTIAGVISAVAAGGAAMTGRTRGLIAVLGVVAVFLFGLSIGMYGLVHRASLPGLPQTPNSTVQAIPEESGQPTPTDTPTDSNSPSPDDVASGPASSPAKNTELATLDLGVINGAPVTAYMGQHRAVKDAMDQLGVTLRQSEGFVDNYPQRCAEGIVVGPLEGKAAVVYAQGVGEGWHGLEWAPSNLVATDGGLVHQQFISPPANLQPGAHFDVSGLVSVDGVDTRTPSFELTTLERSGISTTWQVADQGTVTCDVTVG